jgi:CRP-like cAMP-binding protein
MRWRDLRHARSDPLRHELALVLGCSPSDAGAILRAGTVLDVAGGRVLLSEGRLGRQWIVLGRGSAVVVRNGRTLGLLRAGAWVGEVSLLDSRACTASVVTATPARLVVLDPAAFRGLRWTAPGTWERVLATGAARRHAVDRLVEGPTRARPAAA